LNIVYYTSSVTGFGRIIYGISLENAFRRKGIDANFTIISYPVKFQLGRKINHIMVPYEPETELSKETYHRSAIYKTVKKLKPDLLLVNHLWFTIYDFIDELDCKKLYLSDSAEENFFNITSRGRTIKFTDINFDRTIAIEPFKHEVPMEKVNPLLQRNRDEILSREKALDFLNRDGSGKLALYGLDGHPYETEEMREKYRYLEGYEIIYPTNYGPDIYPVADYFNALDFLICGGGYTQVWEAVYFGKEAAFEPKRLRFSDQADRVRRAGEYRFTENGADQMVEIVMNL
jgi:hypothetical protein